MSDISSRRFILDRIKVGLNALSDEGRDAARERDRQDLPRGYRQAGTLSAEDRLKLFDERVRHYNAATYYSAGNVSVEIRQILTQRAKRILVVPPEFPPEWLPEGFLFVRDEQLSKQQLNTTDGVVSTCALAIAATGTLVLDSSNLDGRRATTLVPDYHLCLLRRENVVELVPEAIRRIESIKARPLTFVSGPSATVDIEMTRIRGVHGPRTLDVLIL
jgi:L-lactate dehydrogenase complex protein LldG